MSKRIKCIFHAESTPSLVLYTKFYKCFGCGKKGLIKDLPTNLQPKEGEIQNEEREDLSETFEYINALKRVSIRGFELPADERGYFIPWNDNSYYKYRLFVPGKGGKYLSPKGHRAPLFWVKKEGQSTLALVEGELNALSVSKAMPEWDVASPGSATMFSTDNLSNYLTLFLKYDTIRVVLDDDAAGLKGLIESKAFFLYKHPFVNYILLNEDPNEVLVVQGTKALREKLQGVYR